MAILCRLGYRPEAFSVGFGSENGEIEAARMTAEFLGVTHHSRVLSKILSSTADANRSLDEPYRAACFYYDALKFAKESGVRYIFDGVGVDEFFGGYGFRYEQVMELHKAGMGRLDAYVQGAHPNDYVTSRSDLFGEKLRNIEIDWNALFPYFDNGLTFLNQMFLADYNAKCRQNFVPLADFAESFRIEVLYPWLDDRLIDFSLEIPADWKYEPETGKTKILFRAALRDLVPKSTMEKKKQGFGPGLGRFYEELRPIAENSVLD
jgi:asparagine synthetase B (glutamine-hydrolysing)